VDSRKLILAVMLDQGLAKKTQEDKGIVCKSDGYTQKPIPKLGGIAGGNGRKKETARKRIKELGHEYRQSSSGAYQVAPACVLHTSPPRRSTPPPPSPSHTSPNLLAPPPTLPEVQRSTSSPPLFPGRGHFWRRVGPEDHSVCSSHTGHLVSNH
jgi:hypothetical protein